MIVRFGTVQRLGSGRWQARGPRPDRKPLGITEEREQALALLPHVNAPDGLTPKQYADRIGVRHGTVKRWLHEGMPAFRAGATVVIEPDKADAWVAENRNGTVSFHRESMVYFAQRDDLGAIKIGFTSNVDRRLDELNHKRKHGTARVYLLATMPGDKSVELSIHRAFAHLSIGDEWFRPAFELVAFIGDLQRESA